jgi:hypothetical protein
MLVTVHNPKHRVSCEPPPPKIPDSIQAWQYIIANWMTPYWQPIPEWVRSVIHFHPQLGMCGGNLVTRAGSNGMILFCNKLNNHKEI